MLKKFDQFNVNESNAEDVNEGVASRVSLSAEDFATLVSGGIVSSDNAGQTVQIALQDIGYPEMLNLIKQTMGK